MHRVQASLEAIVRPHDTGARFERQGAELLIYDCPVWRGVYCDALHALHPNVDVNVCHCDESLSGFVIVVKLRPNTMRAPWLVVFSVMIGLFSYAIYRMGTGRGR
jgi:hypothetical protein